MISVVFVIKATKLIEPVFVKQKSIWVYKRSVRVYVKSMLVVSTTCWVSLVLQILVVVIRLDELFWVLLTLWSDIAWRWPSSSRISLWLRQTVFNWLHLTVLLKPLCVVLFSIVLRLHSTSASSSCTSLIGWLLSGVFISDCANFNLVFWFVQSVDWIFISSLFLLHSVLLLLISFAPTTKIISTSWLLLNVLL